MMGIKRGTDYSKYIVGGIEDQHRDACAGALGLSILMLQAVCDYRRRDGRVAARERLIVAMRETPTDAGLTLSFPDITWALRAKNHSTIITAYKRAKAREASACSP